MNELSYLNLNINNLSGNKELDKLLSELKAKDEPPSQSQADEYERACSELDNLNKSMLHMMRYW